MTVTMVVEDGTGKPDANSYLSVADADTYHDNRGNTTWTSETDNEKKKRALINATQYLDVVYHEHWQALRTDFSDKQGLDWPRDGAYYQDGEAIDPDQMPQELKDATAELALRALSETLLEDEDTDAAVKSESVKIGSLSESTTYLGGSRGRKRFRLVEKIIRPLLWTFGSDGVVGLRRA